MFFNLFKADVYCVIWWSLSFISDVQFGSLKNLKTLWLDDNQLSELPICLCQLSGLTTLRLSGNDLSYIPPSISSLSLLEVLVSFPVFSHTRN